uniref:RNA-dependent RNA polymerase n=1 Tax=Soybean thrips sobemo-like virus 9 TaxID=2801039 RepID=A0A7T8E836_9VIRU|nr:RNA-dependent RNA polymerase [Soybean thrips sobemo-like virus 9]
MDSWFEGEFNKAVSEISMDSSPGLCQFSVLGSTNADVFGYDKTDRMPACDPERLQMVKWAVRHRMNQLLLDNYESDNINVFVKPEPHKNAKLETGRLRLISAVSLVDTMIDRVLFGWLQRKALTVVGRTPCLTGWTPLRGGWRYVYDRFKNKRVCCLDKSSWDWTVQGYMVDLWKEFIKELCVGAPPEWEVLMEARFKILFEEAVFEFKDGSQVKQGTKGIMKSGCLLTLLMNSVGQSMLHYLASDRVGRNPMSCQPITIGDDTTQESFDELPEYVEQIARLGAKVKGFKVQNWVEFIGFAFAHDTCFPAYWQKHLFKLQYCDLSDSIMSYQVLYANEPVMFKLVQDLAVEVDTEQVVSERYAKRIFNNY